MSKGKNRKISGESSKIRQLYIQCRTDWESSRKGVKVETYKPSRTMDGIHNGFGKKPTSSVWDKIRFFCQNNGISYKVLIPAVFNFYRSRSRNVAPTPDFMISHKAMEIYDIAREEARMDIDSALIFQLGECAKYKKYLSLKFNISEEEAVIDYLTDLTMDCSALFRYSCLRAAGHNDLASDFEEDAVEQYSMYSDFYDKLWKVILPADIGTVAGKYA